MGVAGAERAVAEVECAQGAGSLPRQEPRARVALAPVPGQVLAQGQAPVVVKELLPGPRAAPKLHPVLRGRRAAPKLHPVLRGRRAAPKLHPVLQGPRAARKAEPDPVARGKGKSPERGSALAPPEVWQIARLEVGQAQVN